MELAKRTGLIVIIVIFLTGILACFDLYTKLNIKSKVYGYFYSEPEVIQINDFEYDITSLLFTNTGTENQYIAKATTKAVKGFDKNKNYTATINGNLCSTTTNTDYINVTFTNQFNSISDSILMTDELNIKINFYTDGTQLVFITNNGEQAVKLWSSYISKHGFKIKLVESSYTSQIQADIPEFTITLMDGDTVIDTLTHSTINRAILPSVINNNYVFKWQTEDGFVYTTETLPLSDLTLYVEYLSDSTTLTYTFDSSNLNIKKVNDNEFVYYTSYITLTPGEKNFFDKFVFTDVDLSSHSSYSYYNNFYSNFSVDYYDETYHAETSPDLDISTFITYSSLSFIISDTLVLGEDDNYFYALAGNLRIKIVDNTDSLCPGFYYCPNTSQICFLVSDCPAANQSYLEQAQAEYAQGTTSLKFTLTFTLTNGGE